MAATPGQLLGFLALGPLQEELLFRGAIFELAQRSRFGTDSRAAIWISTIFFALHHLQLHGFEFNWAALVQIGFAMPMGLVFGAIRAETDSLWPGLAVHVATNLPGAIGRR
jgi:membrane protease YdiL (CAAX protease family)